MKAIISHAEHNISSPCEGWSELSTRLFGYGPFGLLSHAGILDVGAHVELLCS